MTLKENSVSIIHHSDKGSQYTYKVYTEILKSNGSNLSMSLSGLDNAYAERINRTIKEEYLNHWKPKNFKELKTQLKKAVTNYNNKRQHNNLPKMTPNEFKQYWATLKPNQRPIITIFNNEN